CFKRWEIFYQMQNVRNNVFKKNMKKLVYLHQYFKFPDSRGGTRSYDLSKTFIDKGYKVVVLTSTNKPLHNKWNVFIREGIEVHEIYIPYDNSFNKFQRINSFLKFLFFSTIRIFKLRA